MFGCRSAQLLTCAADVLCLMHAPMSQVRKHTLTFICLLVVTSMTASNVCLGNKHLWRLIIIATVLLVQHSSCYNINCTCAVTLLPCLQIAVKQPRAGAAPRPKFEGPKKPFGPYMWFCKRTRQSLKEAHPNWGVGEVGTEMGQLWQALAAADKGHFQRLAAADKQQYEQVCRRSLIVRRQCSRTAVQPAVVALHCAAGGPEVLLLLNSLLRCPCNTLAAEFTY
jgi:hypothetical protein